MKFKVYNIDYRGARAWDVIDPSKPLAMGLHEFCVSFYLIEDLSISMEIEPITVSATILAECYGEEKFFHEYCTTHVQENLFDCVLENNEDRYDLIDFLRNEFNDWDIEDYYFQKELEQAFQICVEINSVLEEFETVESFDFEKYVRVPTGLCHWIIQGRKLLKKIEKLDIDFSVFPMFTINGETYEWKRSLEDALKTWTDRLVYSVL